MAGREEAEMEWFVGAEDGNRADADDEETEEGRENEASGNKVPGRCTDEEEGGDEKEEEAKLKFGNIAEEAEREGTTPKLGETE